MVTVGPADQATQRVTATVQTTELAVSGTVDRCDIRRPGLRHRPGVPGRLRATLLSWSFPRRPGPASRLVDATGGGFCCLGVTVGGADSTHV